MLDNFINLNAWESLSDDLKAVIAAANGYANLFVMSEFVAKNNGALNTLVSEHGVILKKFPDDVMSALGTLSGEVMRSEEHTSELQSLTRISYAVLCMK